MHKKFALIPGPMHLSIFMCICSYSGFSPKPLSTLKFKLCPSIEEFFEKVNFEKRAADDNKNMKNYPACKEKKNKDFSNDCTSELLG